ncbi:MAG: hypothetical protein WC657_02395 [Candidatus Paceibacterota bacterium]|jgi:DNA-binding NarL/FixJ family response regulator
MEGPQEPINLKDKINETFEKLGVSARWRKAPEAIEGTKVLKDKTIVMVDDVVGVLESFAPHLIVATEGKASFITYNGQPLEELINQILESNPNLVLMDYHLSGTLKGSEVIRKLKEANYDGDSVGFSSDNNTTMDFENAGAVASISKEAGYPEASVKELSQKINK